MTRRAYVAISRVRRLAQLHFWALDITRFTAARGVAGAYTRLRERLLTRGHIERHCVPRDTMQQQQLMPLAGGV